MGQKWFISFEKNSTSSTVYKMNTDNKVRCPWCEKSEIERNYHDTEWGVPLHDDNKLFEFVILDGFQAGLSWKIVLQKRENFRKALFGFDARVLAQCGNSIVEEWMQDAGLVRNRLKLEGVLKNAKAFLAVQKEFGSFDRYIWSFVGGKPVFNECQSQREIPGVSAEAMAMSKDMKKLGFTFCGPTICYAFMQAAGLVVDHITSCYRYKEIREMPSTS
jgi:DNA-3-methyladenine glycosylase I